MTTSRYASLNLDAELTPSPLLVARLVACGLTNERIGHTLGRSANTIKTHLSAAMRKAGATTRYQLVVWLYETRHLQPGLPPSHARPRPPSSPGTRRSRPGCCTWSPPSAPTSTPHWPTSTPPPRKSLPGPPRPPFPCPNAGPASTTTPPCRHESSSSLTD
ncbi:helix-turn-helix domain-containing protein [Saccharopolyspora gregorii]|uniref:helix-turn-helix domain-containing protein n=1 Tax=Saccharopolyspora gregorii TaxID=33914 RepID=UPI0035A0E768